MAEATTVAATKTLPYCFSLLPVQQHHSFMKLPSCSPASRSNSKGEGPVDRGQLRTRRASSKGRQLLVLFEAKGDVVELAQRHHKWEHCVFLFPRPRFSKYKAEIKQNACQRGNADLHNNGGLVRCQYVGLS